MLKKKALISIGICVVLCVYLTLSAFAASSTSWDYGSSYKDQYGSYVPYKGRAGYILTGNSTTKYLTFYSYMYFNQTVVNSIKNYMNQGLYFTWDVSNINDYDRTITATGWYSTNLPNPKFDCEDDPFPFGNGFKDETEVTALSLVEPNKEYYYMVDFEDKRDGTSGGTVENRACLSEKNPLTGEYNTIWYSSRAQATLTYGKNFGQYSIINNINNDTIKSSELNDAKIALEKNKSQILDLYRSIDTSSLSSLKEYKNKVLSNQKIYKENKKDNVLATITFNYPISIDVFADFVNKYDIKVNQFSIRAINQIGDRVTISGKPGENEVVPENILNSMLDKSKAEFKGIIDCYVELDSAYLDKINDNEKNVFLVDTSADNMFITNENKKHIPSLYWFLENTSIKYKDQLIKVKSL